LALKYLTITSLILSTLLCGGVSSAKVPEELIRGRMNENLMIEELEKAPSELAQDQQDQIEALFNIESIAEKKTMDGLKCESLASFKESNGIDDLIREKALQALKKSSSGEGDLCLSEDHILALKKIPIGKLIFGNLDSFSTESKEAVSCIKKDKNFKKKYATALRSAADEFWKGLSDKLKEAIVNTVKNQSKGYTLTEIEIKKLLTDRPSKEFQFLVTKTIFCFADVTKDEVRSTFMISIGSDKNGSDALIYTDITGAIDDKEVNKVVGGGK
jgi:hypothetical protein